MREILFKAKRKNWRNLPKEQWWVEGFLFLHLSGWCIGDIDIPLCPNDHSELIGENKSWFEIDPETLCQYSGLTDKNGMKIWENDICDRKERFPEIVKMQKGDWTLDYSYAVGREDCYCNLGFYVLERESVEVIGNIFDNPELLEVADE